MISIKKGPNDRVLEFGDGNSRNPSTDVYVSYRTSPQVDFPVDFEKVLEISSDEFTCVLATSCFEKVSQHNVKTLVLETFRVLKPGGRAVVVTPDTEAQMKLILSKSEWTGEEGMLLFAPLDISNKSAWSPKWAMKLFSESGFESIQITPFGNSQTDMVIQATKPSNTPLAPPKVVLTPITEEKPKEEIPVVRSHIRPKTPPTREEMFGREYFGADKNKSGYARMGFYWDYPSNALVFKNLMARKPSSVYELGCGRGYVLKRVQDSGVMAFGIDISKHAQMTRACNDISLGDATKTRYGGPNRFDLCFSQCFWEHIPENELDFVIGGISPICQRGLHGITLDGENDGADYTRCTIRSREWWQQRLPPGHEVVSKRELESGEFPKELLEDKGLIKINIGSYMTMSHYGWWNTDLPDLSQFAQANGYRFKQFDARQGIPWKTGEVDAILMCHMLEHITYKEGLTLLKECRRVIKPGSGVIRILVPDAEALMEGFINEKWKEGHSCLDLPEFDHVNDNCAAAPTQLSKLHSLLYDGHLATYDWETLSSALKEAKFIPNRVEFRESKAKGNGEVITRETLDMHGGSGLSLIVEAVPLTG